jgi:hypothetical protein
MNKLHLLFLGASSTGLLACSFPPSNAQVGIDPPHDSAAQWYPVANYMGYHCGSLDCHGSTSRNLIVWSAYGLRLGDAGSSATLVRINSPDTTAAEYNATFRSLVGLEPNVMSVVVASAGQDGGTNPDLLTFLRKARGEEAHKGGTIFTAGSEADVCFTSWLAGSTNVQDCQAALDDADGSSGL